MYSTHARSLKIPRGRGSQKTRILKKSMKPNWNFQRGGGGTKKSSVEEVKMFSGTTQCTVFNERNIDES